MLELSINVMALLKKLILPAKISEINFLVEGILFLFNLIFFAAILLVVSCFETPSILNNVEIFLLAIISM